MGELNISNHARERFAERIMDRNLHTDVMAYVATHMSDIDERINKMVGFGTKIYTGKSFSEYNKAITDVYLKDTWIIIVDPAKKKVVTLYKIDLGLGEEFNKDYVDRLMTKLEEATSKLDECKKNVEGQKGIYNDLIKQNEAMINENNRINKSLTTQNEGYKQVIDGLDTQYEIAGQELREIMGTLVGRKVF